MYLYNYMVMPILLYTSDFWGCLKHPTDNPLERLHRSFYKQVLGVKKQTSTCAVHLETGTVPIIFRAVKSSIKNWERIREGSCNTLLTAAFQEATDTNLPWIHSIRQMFEANGLLNIYQSPDMEVTEESDLPHNLLFQRLKDQYQQSALSEAADSTKLSFYSQFKTDHKMERYLSDITNVKHRKALTRLRMSSHQLAIEEGRYSETPREMRICSLCKTGVEDEAHFLIQCPAYDNIRHHMSEYNSILTSETDSIADRATKLMTSRDLKPVAKFIYEAFEHRKNMIESLFVLNDIVDKIEKQETVSAKIQADVERTLNRIVTKVSKDSDKIPERTYIIINPSADGMRFTISLQES